MVFVNVAEQKSSLLLMTRSKEFPVISREQKNHRYRPTTCETKYITLRPTEKTATL